MLRPVRDYVGICEAHGFGLTRSDLLRTYVSERVCNLITGRFNAPGRKEGQPVSRLDFILEHAFLPMTKVADRVFPTASGLTRMVFHRRNVCLQRRG